LIIGAGPAGLTAAFMLSQHDFEITLIEMDAHSVGGLSRTLDYKGYKFDLGGHRFYTKSQEVAEFWNKIMPSGFLVRQRLSRIFYQNVFLNYPLDLKECLTKLPFLTSCQFVLSYLFSKMMFFRKTNNLEDWYISQFGKSLYEAFFKSYTEKVWGLKCRQLDANWGPQRIQGLSLTTLLKSVIQSFFFPAKSTHGIKTLIAEFRYPRLGPGQLWETCAEICKSAGVSLQMHHQFQSAKFDTESSTWITQVQNLSTGQIVTGHFEHIITSMPLVELLQKLGLPNDQKFQDRIVKFKFRDFITVALIVDAQQVNPDQWLYVQDPSVQVARIQNYKNWSPDLVPTEKHSCLGFEYFCNEGDLFWSQTDAELAQLARVELAQLRLLPKETQVLDCKVVRVQKAYPVYHPDFANDLTVLRENLDQFAPQVHPVGRNGMHRYNNQDHSIMTAMLVAKNIIAGKKLFDPWKVNQDAEYIES